MSSFGSHARQLISEIGSRGSGVFECGGLRQTLSYRCTHRHSCRLPSYSRSHFEFWAHQPSAVPNEFQPLLNTNSINQWFDWNEHTLTCRSSNFSNISFRNVHEGGERMAMDYIFYVSHGKYRSMLAPSRKLRTKSDFVYFWVVKPFLLMILLYEPIHVRILS